MNKPMRRRAVGERVSDPSSWLGALVVMLGVTAVLWAIQGVNAAHSITQYGLQPRDITGLRGVVTEPFLHRDWQHLYSNTVPLVIIGWVLLLAGVRTWLTVTVTVVVVGGLLTWLIAPGNQIIVGASGMIFGWLGYLLARAVFSREMKWILVGLTVLFFFGTLLFGVLPSVRSDISWQAHLCGFLAGVGIAAVLHRGPAGRRLRP